ncbi:hypothetical protein DPMN_081658 [Dreissena polymorpha]|uniref:Uncharacterized protein n=1 Tax=Dreissena polymorpha TaxID=45954 RepID=A0A9D3Y5E4_DREPO|nr:hypothetical protein DPMN_081658 [Dreissena polymorpha]
MRQTREIQTTETDLQHHFRVLMEDQVLKITNNSEISHRKIHLKDQDSGRDLMKTTGPRLKTDLI